MHAAPDPGFEPLSDTSAMLVLTWLFFFLLQTVDTVCPHCQGNFASCTWTSASPTCPTVAGVEANTAIVVAGAGALSISTLINTRFLKMFTRTALESILNLIKRPAPGASFEITETTSAKAILAAINVGQLTIEAAVVAVADLMDSASDSDAVAKLQGRLDCLKVLKSTSAHADSIHSGTPVDMGIFTFLWGRVSEFVMKRMMQVKMFSLPSETTTSNGKGAGLSATIFRPQRMEDFAEMINLFIMMAHALAVTSVLVLTDFFESAVFDTIRLRNRSWKVAHELLLVMFRYVEDSGGQKKLASICNEGHLTTLLEEAEHNEAIFFGTSVSDKGQQPYNGKSTDTARRPCPAFNLDKPHSDLSLLFPNGTCRCAHVCDKFVSDKGVNGRCLGSAGTPGHNRLDCDNPNRCEQPITA